jgi:predicted dehydrogenase
MRYTSSTRRLLELLSEGTIGEVASVEHLEPVGWWHHAHSFVRGSWRRADESSPMLMAKSIHDIDWLGHVIGRPVERVASFGSLLHFRPDKRPAGAGERCVACDAEPSCPYSAKRLYLDCLGDPVRELWPLSVVTDARTAEGVLGELATSPYGRCAYLCDNDVVDHQVVSLEYEGGATASFTMTAFTEYAFRRTRIFGSHGSIEGDGERLRVHDFRNGRSSELDVRPRDGDATAGGGHGGGDAGLVHAFLRAVESGDPSPILSGPEESLASHRVVWAAERARLEGTVVDLRRRPESATGPGGTASRMLP